uniref:Uncharacterized protein n=1 Tax=Anguilla anguilla TaxID=7936 RepID=A0A0E9QML1_ANGAN
MNQSQTFNRQSNVFLSMWKVVPPIMGFVKP